MKCSEPDFRDYCSGEKEPSGPEFHLLVSLIIREQGTLIAKNRELPGKMRARKDR